MAYEPSPQEIGTMITQLLRHLDRETLGNLLLLVIVTIWVFAT
jgi:hypothetical protein